MKKTIGIFAHIDAGKTTFCEQLFYLSGAIRKRGRVDHADCVFDTHALERERGVTVFAHEGRFCWNGNDFYLIDTPGHADFGAETLRAIDALDFAVLLVDGTRPVPPRARVLFDLMNVRKKPCFLFLNKCDMPAFDKERAMRGVRERLSSDILFADGAAEELYEEAAVRDENFMERYLSGEATETELFDTLQKLVGERKVFPAGTGSALTGEGVREFMNMLDRLTRTDFDPNAELRARVFSIRCEEQLTAHVKIEAGTLRVRDAFSFEGQTQKVGGLRLYQSDRFQSVPEIAAGDVAAVTGLSFLESGMLLLNDRAERSENAAAYASPMTAGVEFPDRDRSAALSALLTLQREDPQLSLRTDEDTGAMSVAIMGQLQTEVLTRVLHDRFGLRAVFGAPQPAYRETIAAPVLGIGHYEPLRHYAEAMLAIVPAERGSGIAFESRCHVDELPAAYQSAVRAAVFSRRHRGVLTGAPLCDVKIVLLSARVHEKHTEGGDLREAVWRAVRQGLLKAESLLLEPFCRFTIDVPQADSGRVMSDLQKMDADFAPPVLRGDESQITGRAAFSRVNDYIPLLRASTGGAGDCAVLQDGYDLCQNAAGVIERIAYDPQRDLAQDACSVFCQKGAGFTVSPDEADRMSHIRDGRSDAAILEEYGIV